MALRAGRARPSVRECCSASLRMVSAMTSGICRTLIASVGAVALVFPASETFAAQITHIGGAAPPPPTIHSPGHSPGRSLHHHRGPRGFFPTTWGYFDGPSYNEPMVDVRRPRTSDDLRYTCVYDIPWDYVHRCPQVVAPRD